MSVEDLKKKLRDIGIDPDDPMWLKSKSADLGQLDVVKRNRAALEKVKALLEGQVANDQAQIHSLREQLARLKRGGGR